MEFKRISIFSGHYGSGKTNVAVNFAKLLRTFGKEVGIYDLDIVNPYFRTVDAKSDLEKHGVELIVSPFAETNVDIPAMNAMSYKMHDVAKSAVIDLGGDDRGALALGRFREKILEENDYEFVFVANVYRPETRNVEGLFEIKDEIERASGIKFTGIVNNSNLSNETTIETVENSKKTIEDFSKRSGIPVIFTSVERKIYQQLKDKENIIPLDLIKYGEWI